MGKEGTLEFPIRLITTKEGTLITLPLNPESGNCVSKALYTAMEGYIAQVQSKPSFKSYLSTTEKFPTLKLVTRLGSRYDIKAGLEKAFSKIADKANLNINIFETTLASSQVQEGAKDIQTLESFKAFVVSRIKELGYRSVTHFCEDKGFSRNTLNNIFRGHSGLGKKSKKRLANALDVSQSEFSL